MSGAFIETHRLGKRYGGPAGGEGSWAVRGVTLSVFAGDVTVLMVKVWNQSTLRRT